MSTATAASGAPKATLAHHEPNADTAAWLAVAAGTLGALMATLDISIVNSALPRIQGEIGASGTEGTWIATGYLVAEIIMIPLAGWLERLLGLRTFLLIVASFFTLFSTICGMSTSLGMMIAGRVGQGLTGGAMIPTAQTIIATRLPRHQQPIGTAMFGATAILGPVVGPYVGGWLTENLSWHYAFFLNIPVCIALMALLIIGLPKQKSRLDLIGEADWLGIVGLAAFLGGLTIALEEGQRDQWFSSSFIVGMFALSAAGFVLMMIGQLTAKRPVIRLSILLNRQFGAVVIMGLVIGMVIYGTSFMIPQFLANISNYDSMQSGLIVALSGIPSLKLMPFVPFLIRRLDIRVAVAAGLVILAYSAYMETELTALSDGAAFIDSQLLRGVGTILGMLFLNQAAIQSVSREYASDAAGLFSAARNLGGSFALAGISILQDQRFWFHSRRLEETLNANAQRVQDYVHANGEMSYAKLESVIQTQALTMTYIDLFWILSVGITCVIPLVFFLRPLARNAPISTGH